MQQYNKDSEDEEKELETVFEVKNLKSVLDPDENISIDVPKNCPLLRGDVKFRLTRNEQGIFCKEKAMAVFWNGSRLNLRVVQDAYNCSENYGNFVRCVR